MQWAKEFLDWCKQSRETMGQQADWLESGRMRLTHNNVDTSQEAGAGYRAKIAELDALILKAEADVRNA